MTCDMCGEHAITYVQEVHHGQARIVCAACNRRAWDTLIGDAPPTIWDIPSVRARWET